MIGRYVITLFILFIFAAIPSARETVNRQSEIVTPQAEFITRTLCNISDWSFWLSRDGQSGRSPYGDAGGHFPVSDADAIYTDGIVWGGYVGNDTLPKVGGVTYRTGTVPGWIQANGVPVDPGNPRVMIYRIRPDWQDFQNNLEALRNDAGQLNMVDPAAVTQQMLQDVYDQYEADWNNWPVDLGAPYYDVNENGVFDGGYEEDLNGDGKIGLGEREEPGYARADQVIWYVVNDLDAASTNQLYGSDPIGLEVQTTVWGYNLPGSYLSKALFKKVKIINKSGAQISDMYLCQWSDPDIGYYMNDLCGVDTVLQLAFAYNGASTDQDLNALGLEPTAAGYLLLQGPIIPAPGETAIFDDQVIDDFKNLPMSSFAYFSSGSSINDPELGSYKGTVQFYNLLCGYLPTPELGNPSPFIVGSGPLTGSPTKFPLSGDLIIRTGDVDGMGNNLYPGDRRMLLTTGPFTMQHNERQELVVALVGGSGYNYLNSVAQLKFNAANLLEGYQHLARVEPVPAIGLNVSLDYLTATFTWNDLSIEYPSYDYDLLGYKLYQVDPNDNNNKVEIASFDRIDGITSAIDTINGYPTILYSGAENGLQTTFVTDEDAFTNNDFRFGQYYEFAIQAFAYNENAIMGRKVLSNALSSLSVIFLPDGFESEFYATHSAGDGDGSVIVRVSDITSLNDHEYQLTFTRSESSDTLFTTVTDISETQQLATSEKLVFNIDDRGFQIEISDDRGAIGWDYTGTRWMTGMDWGGAQFYGGLDIGANFFGSTLGIEDIVDVLLEFQDAADVAANGYISKGAVYRRDLGYIYDGTGELPIAAYDISNPDLPRRLNICFVEMDDQFVSSANGIWDMGWNGSFFPDDRGAREYLFINNSDYNEGADYNDSNDGTISDVIYAIWPAGRINYSYLEGTFTMTIFGGKGLSSEDVFTFNTDLLGSFNRISAKMQNPESFTIGQNYPNPFNPATAIDFSIAQPVHVKISVYNILGQQIKNLINRSMLPGNYSITWDGRDQFYRPVSSGAYFYMIQAGDFREIKKMVLIR